MTTALVSAFPSDYRSLYKGLQSHRASSDLRQQVSLALERQLSGQLANSYASSLINLPSLATLPSFPAAKSPTLASSTKQHAPLTASNSVAICNAASQPRVALKEHRKLDRSVSEPVDKNWQAPPSSSRYKTELCRPYEESGTCKYGDKCQFAHGIGELKPLSRHPKYKTELCRTFHSTGFCPYGPRCHFIHNSEEAKKHFLDSLQGRQQSPPLSPVYNELEYDYYVNRSYPQPGSEGDLSPNSSSCSSGSPTSSMGGFFSLDEHAFSEAAPSTTSRGVVYSDYTPVKPLATLPTLIPKASPPSPISEVEVLPELEKLAADFQELDCNAESLARPEASAAVDINRNIRLPIFSKLANSPQ